MGYRISQILNAVGLRLPIYVGKAGSVGINIGGTWAGTLSFVASWDGLNFYPVSVAPFYTAGPTVQTTTANGSWYVAATNYLAVGVAVTALTSGNPIVTLAQAIDDSWQDAFLATTSKWINQASGGGITQTVTIAAQANRAWRLRTLWITASATATFNTSPGIKITDGASSVLWAGDFAFSSAAGGQLSYQVPLPPDRSDGSPGGVVNTAGNSMTIVAAALSGGAISNINGEVLAA